MWGPNWGLTPAESHFALLLAGAQTMQDVAGATGCSEPTDRWHVRQVFAKLGVSQQADLVPLVRPLEDVPEVRGSTTPADVPAVAAARTEWVRSSSAGVSSIRGCSPGSVGPARCGTLTGVGHSGCPAVPYRSAFC